MARKQDQFEALVRATSGDLYRYALWLCGDPALAQDLTQETFLRAWRSLSDLRDGKAAKAWLITILRREHARLYERTRPELTDIAALPLEDLDTLAPDHVGEAGLIRRHLAELPAKYREPLVLQVLGGFSCEEIAGILGLTASAVMTQVFRARQQLRARLEPQGREGHVHHLS